MVRIQGRNVSIFPALSAASSQAGAADAEIKSPPPLWAGKLVEQKYKHQAAGRRAVALADDQHRALGVADHRGGVGAQQIGGDIRPVRSDDHQVGG